MESYGYTHFPSNLSNVHIALFIDVKNASELRERIVKAASLVGAEGDAERSRLDFAFIEAKLVRRPLRSKFPRIRVSEDGLHASSIWTVLRKPMSDRLTRLQAGDTFKLPFTSPCSLVFNRL